MRTKLLAVSALLAAGQALAQPAPPVTRSLYLLDLPFLHFTTLQANPASGRLAVDVELAYGNTFSHTWHPKAIKLEMGTLGLPFTLDEARELHARHGEDVIAMIDGEVTRVALRATYGLGPELAVGLEVPYLSFSALRLDGTIEAFHRSVGLADAQRPDSPRGAFQIVRQRPYGGLEFDDRTPDPGMGDVTASLRWRRALGGLRLAVDAALKLPTGAARDYRGSGSPDVGLNAGAALALGRRFDVRLEAGVVVPGRFRADGPTTLDVSPFGRLLAASQVRLWRRTRLALTAAFEESPFHGDDVGDGARSSIEIGLGVTQTLGTATELSLTLTENVPRYGDAADIAVALACRAGF